MGAIIGIDKSVLFFAVHFIFTALFFFFDLRGKDLLRAGVETAIVFCLPVAGFIIMALYKIIAGRFHLYVGEEPEESDHGTAFFLGHKVEDDIVPLNDAYLLPDIERKRRFFTDAIKQAVVENEQILRMAMHDPDREVAYYAISLLTSRIEKLESRIFDTERGAGGIDGIAEENLEEYAGVLKEYLSHKDFIDEVTWADKQRTYIEVLSRLRRIHVDVADYYEDEISERLRVNDFDGAIAAREAMEENVGNVGVTLLSSLRIAVAMRDHEKLKQTLDNIGALKGSLRGDEKLPDELERAFEFWAQGSSSS